VVLLVVKGDKRGGGRGWGGTLGEWFSVHPSQHSQNGDRKVGDVKSHFSGRKKRPYEGGEDGVYRRGETGLKEAKFIALRTGWGQSRPLGETHRG